MLGELFFFLGLQISQLKNGIFISQTKYVKKNVEKIQHGRLQTSMYSYDYKMQVDQIIWNKWIRSIYISRPYILQFICLVAIFQEMPKETRV